MATQNIANNAVENLNVAIANMHNLYDVLITTNPIAAVYVLEQITTAIDTRNKMANVAGLL